MLDQDNTVLMIIDVQGRLAQLMANQITLFKNLSRMVEGAKILELPIIWAEQLPDKLGPTIPEISDQLPHIKPIPKSTFSCTGNSDIMQALDDTGKKNVLVVGIEAHICVYQTAIGLKQKGYHVEVIADAVGSRTLENQAIGINKMRNQGIDISCVETVFFELMQTAEHPAFRSIQKLFK